MHVRKYKVVVLFGSSTVREHRQKRKYMGK